MPNRPAKDRPHRSAGRRRSSHEPGRRSPPPHASRAVPWATKRVGRRNGAGRETPVRPVYGRHHPCGDDDLAGRSQDFALASRLTERIISSPDEIDTARCRGDEGRASDIRIHLKTRPTAGFEARGRRLAGGGLRAVRHPIVEECDARGARRSDRPGLNASEADISGAPCGVSPSPSRSMPKTGAVQCRGPSYVRARGSWRRARMFVRHNALDNWPAHSRKPASTAPRRGGVPRVLGRDGPERTGGDRILPSIPRRSPPPFALAIPPRGGCRQ